MAPLGLRIQALGGAGRRLCTPEPLIEDSRRRVSRMPFFVQYVGDGVVRKSRC
jgi:hypothetical protein